MNWRKRKKNCEKTFEKCKKFKNLEYTYNFLTRQSCLNYLNFQK